MTAQDAREALDTGTTVTVEQRQQLRVLGLTDPLALDISDELDRMVERVEDALALHPPHCKTCRDAGSTCTTRQRLIGHAPREEARDKAARAAALEAALDCPDDTSSDDPGHGVRPFKTSTDPEASS